MAYAALSTQVTATPIPVTWGNQVKDNFDWLSAEGGWVWVGGSTTEQTTATGAAVDLVTISSLSIVVGRPVMIVFNFRKTSGAAAASSFGLKVNATTVLDPATGTVATTSATNRAEDGACQVLLMPRATNYVQGVMSTYGGYGGSFTTGVTAGTLSATIPNATITSLAIRANSGSASITAAIKDVHVYVLGVDGS